jgi:hypothetical protein
LREHVLDPGPLGARRTDVGTPLEAATETIKAIVDDVDPSEGEPIHRCVPLRAEGGDAERDRDNLGKLRHEGDTFINVFHRLRREPDHQIELHPIHLVGARVLRAALQMLNLRFSLKRLAEALARAVHRRRERAVSPAFEGADEFETESVRSERRKPDFAAAVGELVDDLHDFGMIAHRSADEADALGVARDELKDPLFGDEAHAAVRRPPHHAVGAPSRAAALGFDEEHVRKNGVRRSDRGPGGEERDVGFCDLGEHLAVDLGDEDVGDLCEGRNRPIIGHSLFKDAENLNGDFFRFSDQDRVDERRNRERIRERKWPTGNHKWVLLAFALAAKGRNARLPHHLNHPYDFQFVGDAKGNDWEVAEGPVGLVGDRHPLVGEFFLGLVVEDDALARHARRLLDGPIDSLVPQRTHRGAVGGWVGETDGERGLLVDATGLVGEPFADAGF